MGNGTEWHVTAVRNGGVYGHGTSHCDASGCSGDERYLGDVREVQASPGDVVELDCEPSNESLSSIAARASGEKMARGPLGE